MIDSHAVRRRHRTGQLEFLKRLGLGVKPREVSAKIITKPDHPLRIDLQPPRCRSGIGRIPFRDFVRLHVHLADAVMIPRVELGKPDAPFLIRSNSVGIGNIGEVSKFLGLDVELAQRAARTPDIPLEINYGRMPSRSPRLPSGGVPQIGPGSVRLELRYPRPIVGWIPEHFEL